MTNAYCAELAETYAQKGPSIFASAARGEKSKMSKENTTVYILLGLLRHEPMSGYDLKKRIDLSVSRFWDVGYGQIYPTLRTLEQRELVTKSSGERSGGPDKYVYSISEKGRNVLEHWLRQPGDREYTKYEILVKLFFGSSLPASENIVRIEDFRTRQSAELNMMGRFKESLEQVMAENPDHLHFYLTASFGEKLYRAYVEWADEAIALLEQKTAAADLGVQPEESTPNEAP